MNIIHPISRTVRIITHSSHARVDFASIAFNLWSASTSERRDRSELELVALDLSLEIELAEVGVVGHTSLVSAIEVEERSSAEVNLPWVVDNEVHYELLGTAATASHLLC